MSSQLMSIVPVLSGANYQEWAPLMEAYLMSIKTWFCILQSKPDEETDDDGKVTNSDDIFDWKEANSQALGSIRLRINANIRTKLSIHGDAKTVWDKLKEEYGTLGVAAVYSEFKAMMTTFIPGNSHPAPAMSKIVAHFTKLADAGYSIPERIKAMIVLSKLPSQMEVIAQLFAQADEDITIDKIEKAATLSWEQRSAGQGRKNMQPEANKFSAVKRKQGDQKFSQQQQQQPAAGGNANGSNNNNGGNGGNTDFKGKKRGRRGGKHRHDKRDNDNVHFASTIHTIGPEPTRDPHRLAHTPGAAHFGPPAFTQTLASFDLAHRMGIQPTFETIHTLEPVASSSAVMLDDDETPTKRPRLAARLRDSYCSEAEDAVSLGSDINDEIADAAGIYDMYLDDEVQNTSDDL